MWHCGRGYLWKEALIMQIQIATKLIDQAVILVGGLGTRLGSLTQHTPKPLLPVAGVPFLDHLVFELGRHGIRRVLLCAQFEAEQIRKFALESASMRRFGMTIDISIEPHKAGTGGALFHAGGLLDENFLLLNGDSWLDLNLLALAESARRDGILAAVALRQVPDGGRFGVADVVGDRVVRFHARPLIVGPALINGGVYACSKAILKYASPTCSFEQDILPSVAASGELGAFKSNGYFVDIGIPNAYAAAQTEVPEHKVRPAVFLDRDGVLNKDFGHVGSISRFEWIDGAITAVREFNQLGYYVFLVTNQAGIGKGLYSEFDLQAIHQHMRKDLACHGAHIDDIRYCPDHPEAAIDVYRRYSDWRKPRPGMLLDLMRSWPLKLEQSFLIGDKPSDVEAADNAGIRGWLFDRSNLAEFSAKVRSEMLKN